MLAERIAIVTPERRRDRETQRRCRAMRIRGHAWFSRSRRNQSARAPAYPIEPARAACAGMGPRRRASAVAHRDLQDRFRRTRAARRNRATAALREGNEPVPHVVVLRVNGDLDLVAIERAVGNAILDMREDGMAHRKIRRLSRSRSFGSVRPKPLASSMKPTDFMFTTACIAHLHTRPLAIHIDAVTRTS